MLGIKKTNDFLQLPNSTKVSAKGFLQVFNYAALLCEATCSFGKNFIEDRKFCTYTGYPPELRDLERCELFGK